MKTTDTALLGHVSTDALAAAALSDLWTMTTGVLTQGRILTVLCGSAIGAGNPKLAGIYLQVSYYVLAHIAVFVALAWSFTGRVWLAFGSEPKIAEMAGYYAKVLALSIPGTVAYSQLSQFFSAQRILKPLVHASSSGLLANLTLGMIFVLGIPFGKAYGFVACPIVTTAVIYVQLFLFWFVYVYIQKLHQECWGGWSWKEITTERVKTYCAIYMPAAFSSASDFWRVAAIGTVAAKLGEHQVAVFNASYRIMWMALVLVNAIASASAINMNIRLGKMDHAGAKQAGHVGVGLAAFVLSILGILIVTHVRFFGIIFTNDEAFLSLFEAARWPFSVTLVFMNLAVAIERIPFSMGRTNEVFWIGLVASWGGT
jgi:Na+-driven multidrug efflux pump